MIAATLKGAALIVYVVALATLADWLEGPVADGIAAFGVAMFALHVLELPFVLGHLRRYRGPLAASIVLNLLFGLLHWVPLKRAAHADAAEKTSWAS
jgi:hypothetical protein